MAVLSFPAPLHASIIDDSHETDKTRFKFLESMLDGKTLPNNVIQYDPRKSDPSKLQYEIMFHCNLDGSTVPTEQKRITFADTGYWKVEKSLRFHLDTDLIGWKNISEFYEGAYPQITRTNWVMHEYKIDKNHGKPCDSNLKQESYSLFFVCFASSSDPVHFQVEGDEGVLGNDYDLDHVHLVEKSETMNSRYLQENLLEMADNEERQYDTDLPGSSKVTHQSELGEFDSGIDLDKELSQLLETRDENQTEENPDSWDDDFIELNDCESPFSSSNSNSIASTSSEEGLDEVGYSGELDDLRNYWKTNSRFNVSSTLAPRRVIIQQESDPQNVSYCNADSVPIENNPCSPLINQNDLDPAVTSPSTMPPPYRQIKDLLEGGRSATDLNSGSSLSPSQNQEQKRSGKKRATLGRKLFCFFSS